MGQGSHTVDVGLGKRCNKFIDGNIEFSPVVGLWLHRLQAYRWIVDTRMVRFHMQVTLCRQLSVLSPDSLMMEEVIAAEAACVQKLADLKLQAPLLSNEHHQKCLDTARERGDKVETDAIVAIQCTESTR
jgi:hypothetical protein